MLHCNLYHATRWVFSTLHSHTMTPHKGFYSVWQHHVQLSVSIHRPYHLTIGGTQRWCCSLLHWNSTNQQDPKVCAWQQKHSVFHWVRKKNPWVKCSLVFVLVFFFLNRVTYNPGWVFIHLLLSSFKMKMSTIKQAEMRLPECSTKQLMAVSAVRFYF